MYDTADSCTNEELMMRTVTGQDRVEMHDVRSSEDDILKIDGFLTLTIWQIIGR